MPMKQGFVDCKSENHDKSIDAFTKNECMKMGKIK